MTILKTLVCPETVFEHVLCLEKFFFSSSLVKCVRKVRKKKEKEKHVTHLFPAQGK